MQLIYKGVVFLFFLMLAPCLQAQNLFGFKTGVNLANFAGIEDDGSLGGDIKSILGFQIGALYEIKINDHMSIQPEVSFIQKGFKLTGLDDAGGITYKFKSKFVVNYLEVPILFKYNFGSPDEFRFFATGGTGFAYAMNAHNVARVTALGQTDRERQPADLDELAFNRYEISLYLGTGFWVPMDVGAFFMDVRYALGLTNLNEEGGSDNANYNRGLGVTIGFNVAFDDIKD